MRAPVLALALTVTFAIPVLAAQKDRGAARPAPVAAEADPVHDPELASLRRQLASAMLLSELQLSTDQKTALKSVIAEAKKLREEVRDDAKLAAFRAGRKEELRRAIEEVHTKGSLSEATRKTLRENARGAFEGAGELRDKARSLRESAKKILTKAQLQRLEELREARLERARKGFRGGGMKGHGGALRLLLSDELAAELDR